MSESLLGKEVEPLASQSRTETTFEVSGVEFNSFGSAFGYGVDRNGVLCCVQLGDGEARAIMTALEEEERTSVTVRDPQFVESGND